MNVFPAIYVLKYFQKMDFFQNWLKKRKNGDENKIQGSLETSQSKIYNFQPVFRKLGGRIISRVIFTKFQEDWPKIVDFLIRSQNQQCWNYMRNRLYQSRIVSARVSWHFYIVKQHCEVWLFTLQYQIIMQQIFINFLKKSNLHTFIPSCTYINFRNFGSKPIFSLMKKRKSPTCISLFHPACLLIFENLPSCTFISSYMIIWYLRVVHKTGKFQDWNIIKEKMKEDPKD